MTFAASFRHTGKGGRQKPRNVIGHHLCCMGRRPTGCEESGRRELVMQLVGVQVGTALEDYDVQVC